LFGGGSRWPMRISSGNALPSGDPPDFSVGEYPVVHSGSVDSGISGTEYLPGPAQMNSFVGSGALPACVTGFE
jgi:hypothetical protein